MTILLLSSFLFLFLFFILIIIISPCSPIPFVDLFFSFSLLPKLPTYLVGISEVHGYISVGIWHWNYLNLVKSNYGTYLSSCYYAIADLPAHTLPSSLPGYLI